MLAFRSLVIPLTAATMNLIAAGASFGIVVAIFQWGWLGDAIGTGAGGPIEAFLPVLFFAILFGLSMDYQVFLVSRMHEEWVHTNDNHRAVTVGQSDTGGIITAAGLIMITVFGGFILDADRGISCSASAWPARSSWTRSSSGRCSCPRSCTASARPTGGTRPGWTRSRRTSRSSRRTRSQHPRRTSTSAS
jgi:MMPL family